MPYDSLLELVRAGARVVHVASYEWERVRGWCLALSRDLGLPLHTWSCAAGIHHLEEGGSCTPVEPNLSDPIEAMRRLAEGAGGGVLLLEDIHPILDRSPEAVRWVREACRTTGSPFKILILSTPVPGLPFDLIKEVPTLELALPGIVDLETVASEVAESRAIPFARSRVLLEAALGLTVMEARIAFGRAAERHGRLGEAAVPLILHEKERVIRQSRVLEYHEPQTRMDDVGGLENLKAWLGRRGRAFGEGARAFGLEPPKGVLLLGVHGCGKSLVAKAVSAAWRMPLLRLDMGKVFAGVIGESESNVREALRLAEALSPCVLWIDEIEKGLSGLGSSDRSDAGTTSRVVGTLLTWMQEKRQPVFVVATANRIDLLPPELLRKGRFDEIFFVDLPTRSVREDILKIHLRNKKRDPGGFDVGKLAVSAAGFSGAELEEAVQEAMFEAFAEGCEVATRHIESALESTYPISRTMRQEIEDIRRWARARTRSAAAETPEPLPAQTAGVPLLRQEGRNPFVPGRDS